MEASLSLRARMTADLAQGERLHRQWTVRHNPLLARQGDLDQVSSMQSHIEELVSHWRRASEGAAEGVAALDAELAEARGATAGLQRQVQDLSYQLQVLTKYADKLELRIGVPATAPHPPSLAACWAKLLLLLWPPQCCRSGTQRGSSTLESCFAASACL